MRPTIWVLLLFAASAEAAAPDQASLEVVLDSQMGSSYLPVRARAWLDGSLLMDLASSGKALDISSPLFRGPVSTGVHALALHVVYEGRSPVFGYVSTYHFHMRARATIELKQGKGIEVKVHASENAGLTIAWENRPRFTVTGTPRQALRDVESLPVEKREVSNGAAAIATADPSQQADLEAEADAVVNEVIKEAAAQIETRSSPDGAEPTPCQLLNIEFGYAQFSLTPQALKRLAAGLECAQAHGEVRLRISGHCDARGTPGYNLQLGRWRAESVARFFVEHGIARNRLETVSFGKDRPLCTDDTNACYARNRRAELEILQPTQVASPTAPLQ
jgi:outer membrane protein OmpA-like peptidoglycan-associated protein